MALLLSNRAGLPPPLSSCPVPPGLVAGSPSTSSLLDRASVRVCTLLLPLCKREFINSDATVWPKGQGVTVSVSENVLPESVGTKLLLF